MGDQEMIVVGVDESAESIEALRVAIAEALGRGSRLRVVSAFTPSKVFAGRYNVPIALSDDEVSRNVEAELRPLVEREIPAERALTFEVAAVPGSAGAVLIDESRSAALLVVGHRGRGGVARAALGSVAMQCVLHAECSVMVVRNAAR